ncbi:hypothetical protein [Peribacillus muralis]|uniref:hypothetical protein n=1 Tax=Peribacillus muralis TaxID=264697 RepID=UPI003D019C06
MINPVGVKEMCAAKNNRCRISLAYYEVNVSRHLVYLLKYAYILFVDDWNQQRMGIFTEGKAWRRMKYGEMIGDEVPQWALYSEYPGKGMERADEGACTDEFLVQNT